MRQRKVVVAAVVVVDVVNDVVAAVYICVRNDLTLDILAVARLCKI